MSAIFYVALNKGVGQDFSHYFLYIYSGFIFWNVFFGGISQAYTGFLNNDLLVKNIYFPRFLLPLTFIAAKLVDFCIAYLILISLILWSGMTLPVVQFSLYSLLGLIQLLFISVGCSLLFSVVCVRYRGFQVIFPFIGQAIFFTSSVIYDASIAIEIEWLRVLFSFNPISTVLDTFRLGIFPETVHSASIFFNTLYAMGIGILGYLWFESEDKHLIDRL
jgi:ABC-type polysaccharide/polyol phosphate export permease